MFCLSQDRDDDAMELIEKVYHPSENRKDILEKLKMQVQKKSTVEIPFFQSIFGRKYWRSTLVAMVTTCYSQQSAANVMTMYSNRILTDLN